MKENNEADKDEASTGVGLDRIVMQYFKWSDIPPKNDGDFYYSGMTPDNTENIVAIVHVLTGPGGERYACLFIPKWWRGDIARETPAFYSGLLEEWKGMWSGPEFGLCCVVA